MAYQNVGTPRFYISYGDWWSSLGFPTQRYHKISPTETIEIVVENAADSWGFPLNADSPLGNNWSIAPVLDLTDMNWFGILNHNLKTAIGSETFKFILKQSARDSNGDKIEEQDLPGSSQDEQINISDNRSPDYNGFSIATASSVYTEDYSNSATWGEVDHVRIYLGVGNTTNVVPVNTETFNIGCAVFGRYYEMPNAPNLSLTMSREYGGTKEFTTYNGSSMSNTMWSKAPKWGNLGAWELGGGSPALSRSGRRSWDLKFSYMDDGNLWGSNQSLSTILNTPTGLEGSDFSESAWGTSIISSNDMENYYIFNYSNEYDDFTATPTGFTGTSYGFSSMATTATSGSGTQGDLNITAELQYKVSFHLAIEAKNAWQDPTAPSFGIYNHQGASSPITNESIQDSIPGFNEFVFTASQTDTSALIKFITGNNVDDTITTVSDLKCQPAGSYSDFTNNLLTDENFFSQVWHKTLGGTLPFIFQPDSSNNNPDQFAICKFKDNSLKATQSAFNVYDISLSIEEVW